MCNRARAHHVSPALSRAQRLHADLEVASTPFYSINLDPAVRNLAYEPDIDVRETVDYKGVMKQYQLGPNGGILTALNLFATKFDQVLALVEKRVASDTPPAHVLIDTPGQIEIFTWSASGAVIAEALAASLPTVIVYVVDTPRSARPVTFMSNMLYACSILYKFRLPLLLVFNKTDVLSADFADEWMADCEAFQAALDKEKAYIGSLSRSMALMLDEFYSQLRAVHVSALTGEGIPAMLEALQACAQEYEEGYAVDLAARRAKRVSAHFDVRLREQHSVWSLSLPRLGCISRRALTRAVLSISLSCLTRRMRRLQRRRGRVSSGSRATARRRQPRAQRSRCQGRLGNSPRQASSRSPCPRPRGHRAGSGRHSHRMACARQTATTWPRRPRQTATGPCAWTWMRKPPRRRTRRPSSRALGLI